MIGTLGRLVLEGVAGYAIGSEGLATHTELIVRTNVTNKGDPLAMSVVSFYINDDDWKHYEPAATATVVGGTAATSLPRAMSRRAVHRV